MRQLPLIDPTPSITTAVAAAGSSNLTPNGSAAVVSVEAFTATSAAAAVAAAAGISSSAAAAAADSMGAAGKKKSGFVHSSTVKHLGQNSALDRVKDRLASGDLTVQLSAQSSPSLVTAVTSVNLTGATSGPMLSRSNTEKLTKEGPAVEGVGAQGFNFVKALVESPVL
jgi:hypothetical protein